MNKAKGFLLLVLSAFGDRNGREQSRLGAINLYLSFDRLNLALSQIQKFPIPCSLGTVGVAGSILPVSAIIQLFLSAERLYIKTNVMFPYGFKLHVFLLEFVGSEVGVCPRSHGGSVYSLKATFSHLTCGCTSDFPSFTWATASW